MYVWIIACTDAHTANELDFGQIAQTGLRSCAIGLTASTASMQPRPKEDIKRADQEIEPSHEMNCTDWTPKMCDRSHCINGRHAATAQRGCKKGDRRSGDQTFTRDELHRLPKELCEELFSVAQFQSL